MCFALCECTGLFLCCVCKSVTDATLGSARKLGHALIVVTVYLVAALISVHDSLSSIQDIPKVKLGDSCPSDSDYKWPCMRRQMMYRAAVSLAMLFLVLMALAAVSGRTNKSFWPIKFTCGIGFIFVFWYASDGFFTDFAEICRVLSFFWLLIQAVLLFDFAFDLHELIMGKAEQAESDGGSATGWKIFYLLLSIGFLVAAFVGMGFLYADYGDCKLGQFFISVTLIYGVLTTLVSLLETVNHGLLPPSIMFAYSTFMCWYALLSSPSKGCNPEADENDDDPVKASRAIILAITSIAILWCTWHGTKILYLFHPEGQSMMAQPRSASSDAGNKEKLHKILAGDDVEAGGASTAGSTNAASGTAEATTIQASEGRTSSRHRSSRGDDDDDSDDGSGETAGERVFFHVLMFFLICYGCMLMTDWGASNGKPAEDAERIANESLWLKILAAWFFMALHVRALIVSYGNNAD